MLENFLISQLSAQRDIWFQQDGTTAHTAEVNMDLLRAMFGNRILSRFAQIQWPPRSTDLSAPDLFLCGHLKDRLYRTNTRTIEELKESITEVVRATDEDLRRREMKNLQERLQECIEKQGGHLAGFTSKTKHD
jgi:hypothetical protein